MPIEVPHIVPVKTKNDGIPGRTPCGKGCALQTISDILARANA